MNIKPFLLISVISIIFVSCEIINPAEQIPSYISIDSYILNTVESAQGPSNHTITDVWVTVNGDFIGVYEIPAHFPVLVDGDASIYIMAGIKNNGIAASRENYPFYERYQMDTVLIPGQTLSITPVAKYYEEVVFDWFENFEDPGISLDTTYTSLVSVDDTIINGSKVGLVKLSDAKYVFKAETINKFDFPVDNTTLYMEMDYKNNTSFIIGLMINNMEQVVDQPIISMNPVDDWNKIYIDLSYYSATNNYADHYSVYIYAIKPDTMDNALIMFDNLKLVHF